MICVTGSSLVAMRQMCKRQKLPASRLGREGETQATLPQLCAKHWAVAMHGECQMQVGGALKHDPSGSIPQCRSFCGRGGS